MTKDQAIEVLIAHAKRCPEPEPRERGYPEDIRDDYNEWRERVGKVDEAVKALSGPVEAKSDEPILPIWIKSIDRLPVAQPTVESESLWRRNEFDRGYKAGYEGSAYSPTSLSYIEGYESGELAAMRAGKRRA